MKHGTGFSLIPHPELSLLPFITPQPEVTDERIATRLAAGYCDGAYMAIARAFPALHDSSAWRTLHDTYGPTYAEVRDYLQHENNVAAVLAARVALRLTTRHTLPVFT